MMKIPATPAKNGRLIPPFSSVLAAPDETLYAASLHHGIYRISEGGLWHKLDAGWPEEAVVNRLQWLHGQLFACTSEGLYTLVDHKWQLTEIAIPTYQILATACGDIVATQYGMWRELDDGWQHWKFPESVVFDLCHTSRGIYLARGEGITLYSYETGQWTHAAFNHAVTSLAMFGEQLVGSTSKGHFVIEVERNEFESFHFEGLFLLNVVAKRDGVYACTDHGLFRLGQFRGHVQLFPVQLGCPVADADMSDSKIYMATLFSGIQTAER